MILGLDYQDIITPNEYQPVNNEIDVSAIPSESNISSSPSSSSASTSSPAKLIYKGMEFVEEEDEYKGRELVILKANTGF